MSQVEQASRREEDVNSLARGMINWGGALLLGGLFTTTLVELVYAESIWQSAVYVLLSILSGILLAWAIIYCFPLRRRETAVRMANHSGLGALPSWPGLGYAACRTLLPGKDRDASGLDRLSRSDESALADDVPRVDGDTQVLRAQPLRWQHQFFMDSVEALFFTDNNGVFLDINPAFSRMCGFSREEVLGKTPRILNSGTHPDSFFQDMWRQLQQMGHWEGEMQNCAKDGHHYTQHSRIYAARDSKNGIYAYICAASDISELRATQSDSLLHMDSDYLTGLPTWISFTQQLQLVFDRLEPDGESIGVCYLDLDGFKQINDAHGVHIGNGILQQVALRLQSCVGDDGLVARICGDDFAVLFSHLSDEKALLAAAERLDQAFAEPIVIDALRIKLTISLGATLHPRDGAETPDALIRNAGQAMYIAKQTGKNHLHLFDAVNERILRENHDLIAQILQAFEKQEFQLFYQPKVNMRSGQVIGMEALIRWVHPQQGIIPPDVFLPLIENTEFSVLLGEWVIHQAMSQMAVWASADLVLPVSVNVSAYHLQQDDFVLRLEKILQEFPTVQPAWLELEILETTAMGDLDQVARLLEQCMALGVQFALDDFGTGYSSLTYLRRLPTRIMKIDRSFVIDMLTDPTDLALVTSIVGLAHSLQREVIAEGLDSLEHALPLLRMGCYLAQGYGIAQPMPAASVSSWVVNWRMPVIWQVEHNNG